MVDIVIENRWCHGCFDRDKEFYKWSAGGDLLSKETAMDKRLEFWAYAEKNLTKPCVNLDSANRQHQLALCLECLTDMAARLAKECGQPFVEWVMERVRT